jgi:hypothetical protein
MVGRSELDASHVSTSARLSRDDAEGVYWVVRFLAAGSAVTLAGVAASRFGAHVGGMLLTFPFIISTGLMFSIGAGRDHFAEVTSGVLWGLLPLALFAAAVLLCVRIWPAQAALAVGVGVWLLAAGVLQWLK